MAPGSLYRTLIDHVTDGQLEFARMSGNLDRIRIGERSYTYVEGLDNWAGKLKAHFPGDELAIDR